MSDPKPSKRDREKGQVRAFLDGRGILFQRLEDGPDPPDVHVIRDGLPLLDIEVTEYHPEADHVGIEMRWNQLRGCLNELIRQRPVLRGVHVGPIFVDNKIPSARRHQAITEELGNAFKRLTTSRPFLIRLKAAHQD
jgi:hypothetical protein